MAVSLKSIAGKLFGNDKQLMTEDDVLGINQTWVDETANRAVGTTYTNVTGRPIMVSVDTTTDTQNAIIVYIDSLEITRTGGGSSTDASSNSYTFIVPTNSTYMITISNAPIAKWLELK